MCESVHVSMYTCVWIDTPLTQKSLLYLPTTQKGKRISIKDFNLWIVMGSTSLTDLFSQLLDLPGRDFTRPLFLKF